LSEERDHIIDYAAFAYKQLAAYLDEVVEHSVVHAYRHSESRETKSAGQHLEISAIECFLSNSLGGDIGDSVVIQFRQSIPYKIEFGRAPLCVPFHLRQTPLEFFHKPF